ncbi:MAG: helix-turn-helix domain-containing protein [Candidatus Thermoplasmatota archaeon]|nr:helix-turn-helix domain-containing protein [Candidatus Thermoplasmatota archaeon]
MKNIEKMEGQNLEFKSSWSDECLKTISAFANSEGGDLVVGIDDNGNLIGVKNAKKLLEDIPNKIKNKLSIIPHVNLDEVEGKETIRIEIEPSINPISYSGRFYKRTGSTVQEVSGADLTVFLLSRSGRTWDALPSNAGIDDLDKETFERFIGMAKKRLPEISEKDDVGKILKNLELIGDGKLTNAGVLLFGMKPQRYITSSGARVGRFKTDIDILDTVEATGNLFKQVDALLEGIKKHLNVRFEIKGIERKDIWDYPLEAIREGLINALIHRDYLSTADIQIKVYDDRIKVWNPGKLPHEITVEDLKKEHGSIPRNRSLAYVFYYAGYIEKWGSGTMRIVDLCLDHGLPEPEFKEETGGLSIYFYKDVYSEEHLIKTGLNERQIKAVVYVKDRGKITNNEYQDLFGVSKKTSSRDFEELVKLNLFEKHGTTGKGTYYVLKGSQRGQRGHKGVLKEQN